MKLRTLFAGFCAAAMTFTFTGCSLFDLGDEESLEEFKNKAPNTEGKSIDPDYMKNKDLNPDLSSSTDPNNGGPGSWTDQAVGGSNPYADFGTPIMNLSFDPVYFKFDQNRIESSEQAKLDKVAKYILDNPGTGVVIEGHCDDRGSDEYNRSLGERRALASKEYLASKGVTEDRMRTVTYGEEKPSVPNTDEASRGKNRRDEFVGVTLKK